MFGDGARTNNLVESHNAMLGRLISKGGKFYCFADELRREIMRKDTQLEQLLDGREGVFDEPAKKYVVRAKKISELQGSLQAKRISAQQFLAAITCTHNRNLAVNLCDVDRSEEVMEMADQAGNAAGNICLICGIGRRTIAMLPCNHLALCDVCHSILPNINCPQCDAIVTGHVVM